MDTRTKILSPEAAPRACTVVTGTFDVVVAGDARELAGIRASHPERPLLVVVLPLTDSLLPLRARAELVAALRMVDYVVTADDDAPEADTDALLASLEPAQLVRLDEVHAIRKRQLMEHVQRRQTS
jgi:bifunctional ADP-heptose synthase (sugar kinase/adenylyltransferase)